VKTEHAARLIRLGQESLPFVTVLVCLALTFSMSDSPQMQNRIHYLHNDPFTIDLSERMLASSKTIMFILLTGSLPIFLILKKRFAGHHQFNWERNYSIVTAIAGASLLLRLWQCPLALDDAYVDYRYVMHWLDGQFDYNPGQHIMGFTSHLHLIVLWLICTLCRTHQVDMASYFLNCGLDTINTIFLFFFVSKVYKRKLPGVVAATIFAFSMYASGEVISGKETPLVTLVILVAMWAVQTARLSVLPWTAFALLLLRPEGIFSFAVVSLRALRPAGKMALKSFILPASLTAAYYIFLVWYFGSPLPHGMLAKHKVFPPGDFWPIVFDYVRVSGCMATNSVITACFFPFMGWWSTFFANVLAFIYLFTRVKQPAWTLYRDIAFIQLLFLALAQPLPFSWYLCWFNLLGPVVFARLTAVAWPRIRGGKLPLILPMRAALCLVMFAYVCAGLYFIPYDWIPYLERGKLYREAAFYLMERTGGKEEIAASDVGLIGFYYKGPILDLMGLVSDEPLKFYPISYSHSRQYLIPPEALKVLKPKYLVAPVNHCKGMLLDDPDFQADYVELKRWTNPQIMDKAVCIWIRKDSLVQPGEK
jgi:hypothetical protein